MSFKDGFTFLGEDFGPRYPPVLDDHRAVEPPRRVLYVGLQGSRVHLAAGRLVVESPDDQELLDVPSGLVERLVCFGAVGVSAGARSWALANGVDLVFLSRRGSYLGQAWGGGARSRVARLRAQLASSEDTACCVAFGRAVVEAKVRKQIVVLRRLARRQNAEVVAEAAGLMGQLLLMLAECGGRDEVMGVEGAAARTYFGALGAIMPAGLIFAGRSRQPPLDVVNAALSYGYTILAGEAVSALCRGTRPCDRALARRRRSSAQPGFGPDGGVSPADRGPGRAGRCQPEGIAPRARAPRGRRLGCPAHPCRPRGDHRRVREENAAVHARCAAELLGQSAPAPVPSGRANCWTRARSFGDMDRLVVALTMVIAYDISEDRRRARVAATLQQWGDRVQRSVFICALDHAQLAEVTDRIGEIIDADTDSIYMFRQCAGCWQDVVVLGQATVDDEPYYWAVL